MKGFFTVTILSLFSLAGLSQSEFYSFKVKTLEGEDFDFSSLNGKKVMIVNTASKCGFTPQYEDLEVLHRRLGAGQGDGEVLVETGQQVNPITLPFFDPVQGLFHLGSESRA